MKQKLIALMLVLCSVGALLVPQVMAEEKPVSRIEWVRQLVKAFDMTVEEDNYPDNYYSDMEETSAGYRDLLVAVEFGVIDLEAGSAFEPDQPATREFAAHTLNFCLGFQLDQGTAYTYAESAEVSYPDDLQVAVNRGWFALQDGKVLPQQTLTSTEATAMLKDAAAVMGLSAVSEDYNSVYKFLDGVIVFPDGTDVSVQDDTVTIVNCPVTIQSGDLFVIYQNTIPVGYQATSVAVSRQNTVISAVRAEDGAIFEDVDAQGVIEADLSSVIPLDGSEVSYYVEDLGEEFPTYAQAQAAIQASGTIKSKAELNVKRKVDLGNGGSIELNFKAKNAVVSYNVSVFDGIASVKLDFDYELHHVVKLDYPSAFELDDIRLAILGVPGVGGVTFSVETEASIASDSIEKGHASQELSFSKANGVRFVPKIGAKSFTVSTEGTAKVGLVAKLGITEMPVLNAYGYLKAGVTCELKQMTYNDAPLKCVHFAAYLYANGGFEASVKLFNYSRKTSLDYPIYTDENSPIRIVHHYEDGKNVPKCTRDNVASWFGVLGGFDDWYTSGDSPYMSSGWSSGFGGTGYGRDGQPIVIYTYSLDDDENATITSYKGNATSLIIPSKLDGYTVVAIGNEAFKGNSLLRAVSFPDTVTAIGDLAFFGCNSLSSITLNDGLMTIGTRAFASCTSLWAIDIPDTVTKISAGAFAQCSALHYVKLSSALEQLDAHAFFDCDKLISITIPKTLTKSVDAYINEYAYGYQNGAFYNCDGLKNVTIEDGATIVAGGLFANCPGIKTITIPNSVTEIGDYAFGNCIHLTDVKLSESLTKLGGQSFAKCTALEKITIPNSVEMICAGAFAKCSALSDVKLSSRLVQMDAHAFFDCDSLTSITIPKTLTKSSTAYIPEYAYDYQSGAFYNCDGLKDVTIEDNATVVAGGLFANCPGIETITIPDSVTEIGDSAFFKATGLKHVDFGKGVKTISANAFNTCTSLLEAKLPDSVTSMAVSVFANCTSLTDVTLPSSRENIMASTFAGCTALEKLVLPESVKNIRDSAFKNCTALKELVWSKAPELIESNAFYNCDAITEMDIPATVTSVGYQAFYDCDGLTKITIPDSVTSLGDSVFYDCDALTDVKLGAGITTIPASAFRHCDALEQLTVPRCVTAIKDNAFKDSVKFSSITIPRSVTSISANAFSYPDKLTIYGVAGTYAETFANANSIKFVDRQVSATSASLDQTALTLNKGASGQLTLTVTPEDFTDEVVWKSSDTAVVTVSDTGLVKAVGVGTATIKVSVGKASASCKVTVLQPVTSISLNRSSLTMEATDTFQLQASVYPSNAADQRVQWTSSDPTVTSVDENGLVTALKKGTATVTAAALDGSGVTRTCQVTVSNTAYICTQPEQMESPHDYPDSCTDVWLYTSPGAQKLYVTFDERTCMEDGFDYLYIYDGNGQQIGKYTGTELAGTTVTVPGDTVKIQINSDGSGSEWGFKVTGIRAEASAVVVNPIGGDNAPTCRVDGQTLTVTCDRACVAAYKDADGNYVRLTPTANADGSYSYTLPEGVSEVTVAVRGDLDGDGKLTAKEARRVMTAVTRADSLDALQMLCADLNGDGKISAMEARQILSAVTNSASVKW